MGYKITGCQVGAAYHAKTDVADAADFPAGRDALAVVTSGILNDRPLTVGAVPDDTTAIDTGAL